MSIWSLALIVLAITASLADIITTYAVLDQGGREVGIIAGPIMKMGAPAWVAILVTKGIFVAYAYASWHYSGETALMGVLAVISALTIWAAWYNYGQMR